MKKTIIILALPFLVVFLAHPGAAQNVAFWSIGSGGVTVTDQNGTASLEIGQPVVIHSDNLVTGFWGLAGNLGNLVSIEDEPALPMKWEIGNAYPNPFNPSTTFTVSLPQAARVKVEVYNILGRRVTQLVDATMPAGMHKLNWNARGCASGVYFLRANIPGKVQKIQKIVLVR